jgi:hypothetical protein
VQTLYWKAKYNNHGIEDCYITDSKEDAEEWPFKELGVESFVYLGKIPNYLNDLNAMHEAEKLLYGNPNLPKKYTQQIKNAIRREAGVTKAQMDFDVCITATAAQRAEAFLRTINKWTTNPNEL